MTPDDRSARASIDAHIHLFARGLRDGQPDGDVHRYEGLRADAGIEAAVVVGYEGADEFSGNNAYILELARTRPWIHPLAWIDSALPDAADRLAGHREDGFRGTSLYLSRSGDELEGWSSRLIDDLNRSGLLSINTGLRALSKAAPVLRAVSNPPVLISHLGSPGAALAHATMRETRTALAPLLRMTDHANVVIKLSGLYDIDPVFPHEGARSTVFAVLDAFGPGRVAWGSDFAPAAEVVSETEMLALPDWLDEALTAADRASILGGTLRSSLEARPLRERGAR